MVHAAGEGCRFWTYKGVILVSRMLTALEIKAEQSFHGAPKPASHPLEFLTSVVQCSPSVLR